MTFYDLLHTQEGFLTLQRYFIKAVLLLDNDSVQQRKPHTGSGSRPLYPANTGNQRGSQIYTATHDGHTLYSSINFNMDEFKLYQVLKSILQVSPEKLYSLNEADEDLEWWDCQDTEASMQGSQRARELSWFQNLELFEMLDSQSQGVIGFREFCALMYVVSALHSQQLLMCLYDHGVLLFDILGGGQLYVSGERAKVLARVVGIAEQVVDGAAENQNLTQCSMVGFPDFQMLYFEIFSLV